MNAKPYSDGELEEERVMAILDGLERPLRMLVTLDAKEAQAERYRVALAALSPSLDRARMEQGRLVEAVAVMRTALRTLGACEMCGGTGKTGHVKVTCTECKGEGVCETARVALATSDALLEGP